MKIIFNNIGLQNIAASKYSPSNVHSYNAASSSVSLLGPVCDCVSFSGKTKTDTYEDQLKELNNVHDPYSDVIMISKSKFKNIQAKLKECNSSKDMINVLSSCEKHMFPESEAKVFDILKEETERLSAQKAYSKKEVTFSDILKDRYEDSKEEVTKQRIKVLDDIREYSSKELSPKEHFFVEEKLCVLEDAILEDKFMLKPALASLNELYKGVSDKKKVKEIIAFADAFPNSANSPDAFVVNHAHQTSSQIAEALVSPALVSVEHIRPQTNGGASAASNYIAASKRMNNYRGSMPYADFIEKFPNIPKQTQRYFDDLAKKANNGEILDIALSMPAARDALYKESKGKIDVKLNLNKDITDKIDDMNSKIGDLLAHFSSKG